MLNYHVKIGLVPIRRNYPAPRYFQLGIRGGPCKKKTVAYIEEHFTSENALVRRPSRALTM